MHADTLYHRMLDQEKATEAAKEAGQPIPSFPSLLSKPRPPITTPSPSTTSSSPPNPIPDDIAPNKKPEAEAGSKETIERELTLTKAARKELRKRTKDQSQLVKELEERAMRAEAESDIGVTARVNDLITAREQARKERREKGEATVGDTVSRWLGW